MFALFSLLCTSWILWTLWNLQGVLKDVKVTITRVRYRYVICREIFAYVDLTILNELFSY